MKKPDWSELHLYKTITATQATRASGLIKLTVFITLVFLLHKGVQAADLKPFFHKAHKKQGFINPLQTLFREDTSSCIIPFTKSGNLILIKAKADTLEGNFILDTGAPYLVLNLIYFRDYPVSVAADQHQTSVSGTSDMISKTVVREFSFGSINHYRIDADLIDLGHIENSKGVKILGLIGLSLLAQCEMIIDYSKSLIYLHRIGRKEASRYKSDQLKDEATYVTIPIDIKENKLIAQTQMAGKKLNFVLDSGAESNILDSRLSTKIFENVDITGRTNIRGTDNSVVEALHGNVKNMKIGNENIGILPVLVTNLERTCFSLNSCVNGVLGFDFLPLQKIGFNFVTRKMYLWK